jgi:hypothetical protein
MSDPTEKPKRNRSQPAMAGSRRRVVSNHDGGWSVKSGGEELAGGFQETKAEAVVAAKAAVQVKGGALRVKGRDGRFRESYVIGRAPFTKISAVEGIAPTTEAKKRTMEFDRKGLSPEERRLAIIRAYQPKG